MNLADLSRDQRFGLLERMVSSLEELGFSMKGPRSALQAGEDGVCFITIFHAAKESRDFGLEWAAELRAFNELFSQDKYMRHCGYPLK